MSDVSSKRRRSCAVRSAAGALFLGCLFSVGGALAAITGTWTTNGSTSANSTVLGIQVTWSGNPGNAYGTDMFSTGTFWTDPYGGAVSGGSSLEITMTPQTVNRTFTITFNKAVDDPVLHVDRIGGIASSVSNTSIWTLASSVSQGGGVTMTRLSGNNQFVVSPTTFRRTPNSSGASNAECTSRTAGTGCGSVQFNGTGITSLTFNVTFAGPDGGGDELEFRWSFEGSNVIVRKQSVGGTGSFDFTTSGALTPAFSLNTGTGNPASSASYPVTNHASAINIAETGLATGFFLDSATCQDQNGASVTSALNAATRQLSIASGNYRANQTITCTFVNARSPIIRLQKSLPAGRAAAAHQFNLSIAGPGGPAQVTTTGAGSVATGIATINSATTGGSYTLSESASGMANLSDYDITWSCANARAGGQTPSGSGSSFALVPALGDDLTCTFVNTARPRADLAIAKSNSANGVIRGQPTTYSVVVTNNGPATVNGATVTDTPGSGLVCPPSNPVTCTSSASPSACPAGPLQVSSLAAGVALGNLPATAGSNTVTFVFTCTVP